MVDTPFSRVKDAVSQQPEKVLEHYGVRHARKEGQKLEGLWTTGFLCPLCGDKSGSASFTRQCFLKCHQCGSKLDVFEWLAKHTRKSEWIICKELSDLLNCKLPKFKRATNTRAMPAKMTEDLLHQSVSELWDNPDAEPARAFLSERHLAEPSLLTELGLGWHKGWILFSSRGEDGKLLDRYRGWNPTNPQNRWMWFGAGSGGPGIWPCRPAPDGSRIMLLEGESDVLTALVRLRLQDHGWHPCTWTAGATSSPKAKDVPQSFAGKPVWIGYDNDVFQGPDYGHYFVQSKPGGSLERARTGLEQRLRNLLSKVGPTFASLGCEVTVAACPIDPKVKFGGDFRDWVDAGGRNVADWKTWKLEDLPVYGRVVTDLPFAEVFSNPHKIVRTTVQVEAIARDDVIISSLFEMKCEMGSHAACGACPGARQFPDRIIDMTEYQRELAVGLEQQHVAKKILDDIVQQPSNCPRCEVVPLEVVTGSEWKGMKPGKISDAAHRSLHVFSHEPPSLSGEMEIEGTCYPNARGNGIVMLATSVKQLDKAEIDLAPTLFDLREACPFNTNKVEDIDEYLDRRHRDLAFNVTKIYGRRDIQIAHDLLAHSVLRAELWGAVQRSWLDVCVFGDTRTGKSLTFRRMMDFHQLGLYHTAVSNTSRAGLLLGADKAGMMKPGVMPRCNGKMAMIDEFHFLVQNSLSEHPMSWMQGARDSGVASAVKIYGSRDLPAAVRLVTIANWMRNKRKVYQFDVEHLGALYGAPETLARLDFAVVVNSPPSQLVLDPCEQFWTRDRTRALILRAWSQDPSQVMIDDDASELARQICKDWTGVYDSIQLPLFTPEEKPYSLMRIAIACANLCFSHVKEDPYSVHVRKVHVEWAINWLLHTWKACSYDIYSAKLGDSQKVLKIFDAERDLTVSLLLEDNAIAASRLTCFLTPFSASEIVALTGLEVSVAHNWLSKMLARHVFERVKEKNAYSVTYQLTDGGQQLVSNLIRLAEGDVAQWTQRYATMKAWQAYHTTGPDLVPMNDDAWALFSDGQVPF